MDRSEGRNAGKTDGPTVSPISPGRVAGRESREGSDGGDGGDDGGRQELLSYVRGRHGSLASHSGVTILPSSLTYILLFSLFIILFHHRANSLIIQLDLDPSPNSAMDFYFSLF